MNTMNMSTEEIVGLVAELTRELAIRAGMGSGIEQVLREKACPECGKQMKMRNGKHGQFLGCVGYPKCKHTEKL
jgi:ssDNA-binding Zn-finger/Zn-ribbon topoisomerase 1